MVLQVLVELSHFNVLYFFGLLPLLGVLLLRRGTGFRLRSLLALVVLLVLVLIHLLTWFLAHKLFHHRRLLII